MLSFRENIPIILQAVEAMQPKKVADVGAGMGKFGLLIREQYLSAKAEKGELEPVDDIVIDAIEDTRYLLTDRLRSIYNSVIERDVFECGDIFREGGYDIVLMIDTVEHWEKEKTINLLKEISKYSAILVSTPRRTGMYSEHFYGDPRHHITQWTEDDFTGNFETQVVLSAKSHIIIIKKRND